MLENMGRVSGSSKTIREMIDKAIEKHEITKAEYDKILHLATDDSHIDPQEKVLLSNLNELIYSKDIKIVETRLVSFDELDLSDLNKNVINSCMNIMAKNEKNVEEINDECMKIIEMIRDFTSKQK